MTGALGFSVGQGRRKILCRGRRQSKCTSRWKAVKCIRGVILGWLIASGLLGVLISGCGSSKTTPSSTSAATTAASVTTGGASSTTGGASSTTGGAFTSVTVPNVVGLSLAGATSVLSASGLSVQPTVGTPSEAVAAGNVVSQSPPAGTTVKPGTTILVSIASPPPTSVPPSTTSTTTTVVTGTPTTSQ